VPPRPAVHSAGPVGGDDGGAVHGCVRAAADQDMPPARSACDGRNGGADSDQGRRKGQPGGHRQGACRQAARGAGRARWYVGGTPGAGDDCAGGVRPAHGVGQPVPRAARGGCGDGGGSAQHQRGGRRDHGGRAPRQHRGRADLHGQLAQRKRMRADPQSDGGRCHGRDRAVAAVPVGAPRCAHRRHRSCDHAGLCCV
ncbi:hypothetical protein EV177_010088, partial [Coemansia sp. RSA 1804]